MYVLEQQTVYNKVLAENRKQQIFVWLIKMKIKLI